MPLPLAWVALAAVLGALCAAPLPTPERVSAGVVIAAGVALLGRAKEPRLLRAAPVAALVVFFTYATVHREGRPEFTETGTARYEATVVADRAELDGSNALTLRLPSGWHVRATVSQRVRGGEVAIVRGRLTPLDGPRNPGDPSARDIAEEQGIAATLQSAVIIRRLGTAHDPEAVRAQLLDWCGDALRAHLAEPDASIVAGELWGERAALPPDLKKEFQQTGTVHVLVTAG